MRSSSRLFLALAAFGVFAAALFSLGLRNRTAIQGASILLFFAVACGYLAYMLAGASKGELDGLADTSEPDPPVDLDTLHLPGPSWMPAAYGVSLLVVMLGLVFNYNIALAGVALTVLTTIGWGVESVKDYRREIEHHVPEPTGDPRAVTAAHRVQRFASAHHGADAVVQHIGRGRAEIVLVGADGAWGNVAVADVDVAREACRLAGVDVHADWPNTVANRVRPDQELWLRMAGTHALEPSEVHAPRDGETQDGARVFLALALFGVFAATLFWAGQRSKTAIQGTVILGFFTLACGYLFVALRAARGQAHDQVYADASGVTREPTEPDPPVDLATLHLPGPSWMPLAYGVSLLAVMLGLVFSWALALAGLVLTVLTTIGWGVESVREYRAALAHSAHGAAHAPDHVAGSH